MTHVARRQRIISARQNETLKAKLERSRSADYELDLGAGSVIERAPRIQAMADGEERDEILAALMRRASHGKVTAQ